MATGSPSGPAGQSLTERGHACIRTTAVDGTGKWATKSGTPKGLFATKDLSAGSEIFTIPRPLLCALNKDKVDEVCANCFKMSPGDSGIEIGGAKVELKACTGCKQVKYCGKKCQAEAWKRSHKLECRAWEESDETRPKTRQHIVRAVTELLWRWHKGLISQAEWDDFQALKSNHEFFSTRLKFQDKPVSTRQKQVDLLGELIWGHTNFDRMKKSPFTQEQCVRLVALLQTNSHTLVTPAYDPIGIVFDPFAARANHSCTPNAYIVMNGPALSFRTLQPVEKDAEIFISYIETSDSTESRLGDLETRYYFTCTCPKCKKASGPEDAFLKPMPIVKKEIYDMYERLNFHDILDQCRRKSIVEGEDLYENLILATEKNFQEYLRGTPDLDEPIQLSVANLGDTALMKIQDLMKILRDTRVWSQTRSPYPALRHEYFLGCLTTKKYSDAFYHGLKTYFDIDPVLYSQPHHPLRVVHTFVIARLAIMFIMEASADPTVDPAGTIKFARHAGYDFAPLVYKLLKDAVDNVGKSHGEGNLFTAMVKEKWEEVITDMGLKEPKRRRAVESIYESNVPFYRKIVESVVEF